MERAVKTGKLPSAKALKCSECGQRQAEDYHHHKGYDKEHQLDVVAVCRICHGRLSSKERGLSVIRGA